MDGGIDGVGSGTGVNPSAADITTPFTTEPTGTVTFRDSLASGGTVAISLNAYESLVSAATSDNQEAIILDNQSTATSRIPLYLALLDSIISTLTAVNSIYQVAQEASNLSQSDDSNISTLNSASSGYNANITTDAQQIQTMNTAISSGNSLTYAAAALAYNTYVTNTQNPPANSLNSAISTFNSEAGTINAGLTNLNSQLPSTVTPFTLQTLPTNVTVLSTLPIAAPPFPPLITQSTATFPTITNTITPNVTNPQTYISSVSPGFFNFFFNLPFFTQKFFGIFDKFAFAKIFDLPGKVKILNPAFTTPQPRPSIGNNELGGQGSSVPLALTIANLSNPLVSRIIENGITSSALKGFEITIPGYTLPALANAVGVLGTDLLLQQGLLSVNTAIRLLGGDGALAGIDPRESLAATAIGIAFLDEIANSVAGQVFVKGIPALLAQLLPNLSATQIAGLSSLLIPAVELVALYAGLLNLSVGLQSNLLSQLLGTPGNQGLVNANQPLNTYFSSPANAENFAAYLATQNGLNEQQASAIANNAAVQSATNAEELQSAINQAALSQGVNAAAAGNAALNGAYYVQAQSLIQPFGNTNVTSNSIIGSILDNIAVAALLNNNGGTLTGQQLVNEIAASIQQNAGVSSAQALLLAAQYVGFVLNPTVTPTTTDDIKNNIQLAVANLQSGTAVNVNTQALEAALISTVLDSNISAHKLITDRIQLLTGQNDANLTDALVDLSKAFTSPNLNLIDIISQLTDPATRIATLARGDSHMEDLSPSKPGSLGSQTRRDIDIHV